MLLSSLLASLLATAATLASPMPAPIPAEIDPVKGPFEKPAETTWYCAYSYEIVFEHYELVGWKWGIDEQELRELIPGMVKGYYFNQTSEYGFRAEVSLVPFVPHHSCSFFAYLSYPLWDFPPSLCCLLLLLDGSRACPRLRSFLPLFLKT
jgi:hypothetical protein